MTAASLHVEGELTVPGDKSISHRALIVAALAEGRSRVRRILPSADVRSTAGALRALGAAVPPLGADMTVESGGQAVLLAPAAPLDCGNSGTTTRLLAGVVAGCRLTATFAGDASLSRRPMGRVARPLTAMGAQVELPAHGGLPMTVRGAPLHEVEWRNDTASAQVKSCILFAAFCAGIPATVHEPARSRDHTERLLAAQGVEVRETADGVRLTGGQRLAPLDLVVPGDPSSAAFFAALSALAPRGELLLRDVCVNATRTGFLDALTAMGAAVAFENREQRTGEWIADVRVRGGAALRGITVGAAAIPTLIDELPLLACVAAYGEGEVVVTGAAELRVKESDRIATVVRNLRALGAEAEELSDGFVVRGTTPRLRGTVRTEGDHRLAMAFGVLSALPGNEIVIDDPACVDVSYPGFWTDLARLTA